MNSAAVDKVVEAVMAKGQDFALAVMAGLAKSTHSLPIQQKATTPWVHQPDDSWTRSTWNGETLLARVYQDKSKWAIDITGEAGVFPGKPRTMHRNAKRAKQVADQALDRIGWNVVAPEEK